MNGEQREQLRRFVDAAVRAKAREEPVAIRGERGRNTTPRRGVETHVIARTWRGWTKREDADAYFEYVEETGGRAARSTPGNLGYYVLRRDQGDRTEFVTMSLWESQDAIRAFAGDNIEVAFFPDDDRFLVDRETFVTHYEIAGP